MKNTPAPIAGNFPKPGTIFFGPARETREKAQIYSRLFKCRKDGFDFMGQIKIDFQIFKLDIEIFNANYFDFFNACEEEITLVLEKKVLSKLLSDGSLSEEQKKTVRILVDGKGAKNGSAPKSNLKSDGKISLQEMFDRLNTDYFENKIIANVEWGKKVNKKNLTSFRFGSYDPEKKLIRIHPRLQQDFVPRSVLELTLYHEMCHQWAPMKRQKRIWVAHHPQFKEKEREYRFFAEARAWEKENWKKLMGPVGKQNNKSQAEASAKAREILEIPILAG